MNSTILARVILSLMLVLLSSLLSSSSVPAQGGSPPTNQPDVRDQRLLTSDSVKELPAKSKRYALIIGVDKYEDAKITSLRGATNDAKTLAEALKQYAGFPADQVFLLTNQQPPELQPRRNIILELITNLANTAKKDNGMLLISFAGHGIERGGRSFLLSADTRLGSEFDVDLLEDTAVNVNKIKDRLKGLNQVILIIDACRNDPNAGRSSADNPLTDSFTRGFSFDVRNREVKAFATLYATSPGQISYEYKEKEQGYFTWALVEALRGNAANLANKNGEITLGSLVGYLQERVPKLVSLNGGRQQRPHLVVDGYNSDQLVISVVTNVAVNVNPGPSNGNNDRELNFWLSIKDSTDPDEYQAYLKRYPDGEYAELARSRMKKYQRNGSENSNQPAALTIVFDQIRFPNGRTISIEVRPLELRTNNDIPSGENIQVQLTRAVTFPSEYRFSKFVTNSFATTQIDTLADLTIPAGTILMAKTDVKLTPKSARIGDRITATLVQDIYLKANNKKRSNSSYSFIQLAPPQNILGVPAGSILVGRVTVVSK